MLQLWKIPYESSFQLVYHHRHYSHSFSPYIHLFSPHFLLWSLTYSFSLGKFAFSKKNSFRPLHPCEFFWSVVTCTISLCCTPTCCTVFSPSSSTHSLFLDLTPFSAREGMLLRMKMGSCCWFFKIPPSTDSTFIPSLQAKKFYEALLDLNSAFLFTSSTLFFAYKTYKQSQKLVLISSLIIPCTLWKLR